MTVAVVLVSHSRQLADGVRDIAAQMAPASIILTAGGDQDGGIGTSFELIRQTLHEATDHGRDAVVFFDLGSALLSTESALELLPPQVAARCTVVHAPLIEGALAAAIAADGGGNAATVVQAAYQAAASEQPASASAPPSGPAAASPPPAAVHPQVPDEADPHRVLVLVNHFGLHARPAAALAGEVHRSPAQAFVHGASGPWVDVTSVLSVVGQSLRGGEEITLATHGPGAGELLERLSRLVEAGFGDAQGPTGALAAPSRRSEDGTLHAAPAAPGLALGALGRVAAYPAELPARAVRPSDLAQERERLHQALTRTTERLDHGEDLTRAHAAILRDPQLFTAATTDLQKGAAAAWWSAVHQLAATVAASADEFTRARASDVLDAGARVLEHLGIPMNRIGAQVRGQLVLADDIGPSELALLAEFDCAAVILRGSSPTAHAVIVARGLGLPMVVQVGDLLDQVADDTVLLLDGGKGTIEIDPASARISAAREQIEARRARAEELRIGAAAEVQVAGRRVHVAANVGSIADAQAAVRAGADGVGLLRTELLVLGRAHFPSEDEQVADLTAILDVIGQRPVVVRVLDIGGDKPMDSLGLNPLRHGFLGVRGLRYLLEQPELLQAQLRAICRASVDADVSVMAPMVTTVQEAHAFRAAVDQAVDSLVAQGIVHAAPRRIGVMVETPAAALTVDRFAAAADFVSIGSNDLLSYTVAAERTDPAVAHLLDDHSLALTRLLDRLLLDAAEAGLPVSVCGELAAHPGHAVRLVQGGVGELSMSPARIPEIKAALRELGPAPQPSRSPAG